MMSRMLLLAPVCGYGQGSGSLSGDTMDAALSRSAMSRSLCRLPSRHGNDPAFYAPRHPRAIDGASDQRF